MCQCVAGVLMLLYSYDHLITVHSTFHFLRLKQLFCAELLLLEEIQHVHACCFFFLYVHARCFCYVHLQLLQNLEYSQAVQVHIVNNGQEMTSYENWDMAKFLA